MEVLVGDNVIVHSEEHELMDVWAVVVRIGEEGNVTVEYQEYRYSVSHECIQRIGKQGEITEEEF